MTEYQLPFHTLPSHKRVRRSYTTTWGASTESSTPAPAYPETPIRRSKSLIPARVMRCFTTKQEAPLDPNTIPLLSRREQRKQEKRERRYLEELKAYQRKQFHDQISRQLEVSQSAREPQLPASNGRRSVREKVKSTLRRTRKGHKKSNTEAPQPGVPQSSHIPQQHDSPPHIDDFQNKGELRRWFHPSDVEATPAPAVTITDGFPAELPAADVISPFPYSTDIPKKHFDDNLDLDTLPPPARSPSPCLSSIPRRNITISETPTAPSSRQMQCDYCHGAIKLTGFHYACNLCNDGDCLYCAKCANEGRTCRHELIERTRNIKRHPTNPQNSDRRSLCPEKDKDSVVSSETSHPSVELSATMFAAAPEVVASSQASSSNARNDATIISPISPSTSEDLFRDFEAKRREQEVAFREKEVTLREREATLREREAWTATKERDVALVQQLHAAAMLQQRAEVGAQFTPCSPVSRLSSCCDRVSRHSSCASYSDSISLPSRSNSVHQSLSRLHHSDSITLRSVGKGKKPNIELASSEASVEASTAGIETVEHGVRSHANSNKRKAAPSDNKAADNSSSRRKSQGHNRRSSSRRSNDEADDQDEGDDSDTSSPKRQKQEDIGEPQKLFACPYYKHDPVRYAEGNTGELHYRGCAGGLYRDISRVKQHLKRIHHRPDHYCRRCFVVFDNNDKLQKHSSSRQGCDAKECPYPERLNETQQAKIHVKRPGKDPKELWFEIYSIIFPDSPLPESPYIEQVQPKGNHPEVLEQFIDLFNRKLDMASQSEPWLAMPSARDFLNTQMMLALRDLRNVQSSTGVPSVLVSPVSPPQNSYQSRHGSNSSRASSSAPQHSSAPLSPVSTRGGLRPALKVTTYGMDHPTPSSSASPFNSAKSQRNASFPKVPVHVKDDTGYGKICESWVEGDDMHVMGEKRGQIQEPSSATSERSTKSVSFAPAPRPTHTPPRQPWAPCMDCHSHAHPHSHHLPARAPTLSDFANFDWSAQIFADDGADMHMNTIPSLEHHNSHSSSLSSSSIKQQKRPQRQRADSAYGTLSSAQVSRTSLFQPQAHSHSHSHSFDKFGDSSIDISMGNEVDIDQMACVDPQMLFVNPSDFSTPMTPGLSADVQAYLNRNRSSGSGEAGWLT